MSKPSKVLERSEIALGAFSEIKVHAVDACNLLQQVGDQLDLVEANLRTAVDNMPLGAKEAKEELYRMLDRVQRARQLRNQMELGGLMLALGKAVGLAYQALP